MSVAEQTAHQVYQEYGIGTLTDEVQRQLVILILNKGKFSHEDANNDMVAEELPPRLSVSQLRGRIAEAEEDIKAGRTLDAAEMESMFESKYPWLGE